MKSLMFNSVLILGISAGAFGQQGLSTGVSSGHRPNEHTLQCLLNLNKECAIQAAVQTVIDEELGLERAKVLVGVARSLIADRDFVQAQSTLNLALEEARSAKLGLVTQEKIKDIAPLMARAGNVSLAVKLANEIEIVTVKDQVLTRVSRAALRGGSTREALEVLVSVKNKRLAFWRRLDVLLKAVPSDIKETDVSMVRDELGNLSRADDHYRGLVTLSLIEEKLGRIEEAAQLMEQASILLDDVQSSGLKAELMSIRVRATFEAGYSGEVLDVAYMQANELSKRLTGSARQQFASRIGQIEAATDRIEMALERVEVFEHLPDRARYVASLVTGAPSDALSSTIDELMMEIKSLESAYERDELRLSLLEGAIGASDIEVAKTIVGAVEDDDNQALALALLASLL